MIARTKMKICFIFLGLPVFTIDPYGMPGPITNQSFLFGTSALEHAFISLYLSLPSFCPLWQLYIDPTQGTSIIVSTLVLEPNAVWHENTLICTTPNGLTHLIITPLLNVTGAAGNTKKEKHRE
jgi:hypothetical protein